MDKQLIMYSRTTGCPFVTTSKHVLSEYNVSYSEIFTDRDPAARQRLLDWVGFLSVPTLIVAYAGEIVPYAPPVPLEKGRSPRGINRGTMITEPYADELKAWLKQHGFIA